jgi:hypothetical protein
LPRSSLAVQSPPESQEAGRPPGCRLRWRPRRIRDSFFCFRELGRPQTTAIQGHQTQIDSHPDDSTVTRPNSQPTAPDQRPTRRYSRSFQRCLPIVASLTSVPFPSQSLPLPLIPPAASCLWTAN